MKTFVKLFAALSLCMGMMLCASVDANAAKPKTAKQIQDSIAFEQAKTALLNMDFVLNAERSANTDRVMSSANKETNFISVHQDKPLIQTTNSYGFGSSSNGLGGITLTGTISNVKKTDKNGKAVLKYSVNGRSVNSTVTITLTEKNGAEATAIVKPNVGTATIYYYGNVSPYNPSLFFKGAEH